MADGCPRAQRRYVRRDPAACPVNGVVRTHLETFLLRAQHADRHVPRFVERELRSFVRCGVLAHGFVRVYCKACQTLLERRGRVANGSLRRSRIDDVRGNHFHLIVKAGDRRKLGREIGQRAGRGWPRGRTLWGGALK